MLENNKGDIPCRNWGLAYESTNRLINSLCDQYKVLLTEKAIRLNWFRLLIISTTSGCFKVVSQTFGLFCGAWQVWVNAQFITPSGCSGRLGSFVTDAELGDNALVGARSCVSIRSTESVWSV